MIIKIPKIDELKKNDFNDLLNINVQKKLRSRSLPFKFAKRLADVISAIISLIVLFPLFAVLIILIKFDSKGKAIFAQQRVGIDAKLFTMYKFRTMKNDSNKDEFSPISSSDERITKIGKFLRKSSLDELPQLWNVLIGNMSFVGPRPEMLFIVKTYSEIEKIRLIVKPGLTGIWQIAGRKDLPLHENIEFDLYYIKNQSLMLDLIILLKTFSVVLSGKGAY